MDYFSVCLHRTGYANNANNAWYGPVTELSPKSELKDSKTRERTTTV